MAANYRETLRIAGKHLAADALTALGNTTARGDKREELVCTFLRDRVGTAFGVTKGEVIDSVGKTTGEYDAIIFDSRVAPSIATEAGRQVVRVEAVVATVEVKSELKTEHLEKMFTRQNKEILQLNRFYNPTKALRPLLAWKKTADQTKQVLDEGINPMDHYESIPSIVSFVLGLSGPKMNTIERWLQFPGVDVVCVLGKYTAAKNPIGFASNPPDLVLWAEEEDALGAFLYLVETALENHLEARTWVAPQWRRYFFSPEVISAEQRVKK